MGREIGKVVLSGFVPTLRVNLALELILRCWGTMEGWHCHEMTGNSGKEMTLDEEEKESWRPDLGCVRKTLGKNNEDLDSPPQNLPWIKKK